jgi:phytase-like protein
MKRIPIATFLTIATLSFAPVVCPNSTQWVQLFIAATVMSERDPSPATLQTKGRWVLDPDGKPIRPPDAGGRMQGLQTSGLDFDGKFLWAVGDQRSNYAGNIFRIDPGTARLAGDPVKLDFGSRKLEIPQSLRINNPDLEGLCIKDSERPTFYIAVETDGTYVLESHYEQGKPVSPVDRVLLAHFDVEPAPGDPNSRFEGVATDGKDLFLAYERDGKGRPHIYRGPIPLKGSELQLQDLEVPFSQLPPRPGKGTINVNDLTLLPTQPPTLAIIARDQERLLFFELTTRQLSYVDLDFRDPDDQEIYWTSPEGIAADLKGDRLWLITDPDSLRGNYRRRDQALASGNYADMVPLLFEMRLSRVLSARTPVQQ